jgi:N,N-dimethylformamidase
MTERLLAYSDRISAAPGERVEIKVSAPEPGQYRARLIRLICGDDSPGGPGFKEAAVASAIEGDYPARRQSIHAGSHIDFHRQGPVLAGSFTLMAMIWPTLPEKGVSQAILGNFDAANRSGCSLLIDASGRLAVHLGASQVLHLDRKLIDRTWYLVSVAFDSTTGALTLRQQALAHRGPGNAVAEAGSRLEPPVAETARTGAGVGGPFRIAAWSAGDAIAAHYNGKIDSPCVIGRALDGAAIERLAWHRSEAISGGGLLAAWDFSRDISGIAIADLSGNGHEGRTVNLPARAMKGWNWDGTVFDWTRAPEQYGAIHFHDDDLYDCEWESDFAWELPADLKSGIYCVHLTQQGKERVYEDYCPVFVRPAPGQKRARLALLIPTASYWAYANHQMASSWTFDELSTGNFETFSEADRYLEEHLGFGLSVYDLHSDGSGVCHASALRPVLNMRPKSHLWQFNADTHITDWLEAEGIDYDVITDDDLEREGPELLKPYRCVMTGTHPEYYSLKMLDAVQGFTDQGGRLIYLGANGFYWRIAYHPELPGVIEHRRAEDGMRAWIAEGGEYHMSFTGELSGLWRRMDRAPNLLVGTGFTAQGFDHSSAFRRRRESLDPRAAFIFAGLAEDETIGDFGSIGGGAAGWEIDRADHALGTPRHALIVAEAVEFPASYHWVKEEFNHSHSAIDGDTCPLVRCDMVFFETPNGGAVFSVSSISWAGALAHAGYKNNVSRITGNVVKRFLDPAPFPL